jgi:hypothetical protein
MRGPMSLTAFIYVDAFLCPLGPELAFLDTLYARR